MGCDASTEVSKPGNYKAPKTDLSPEAPSVLPGTPLASIPLLQSQIEGSLEKDYQIAGLGCHLLTIGYYEWFVPRWYSQEVREGRLADNPYDALSLCLCVEKGNKKVTDAALDWYRNTKHTLETRINKAEEGSAERAQYQSSLYQVLMGYANLLSNTNRFDKALNVYKKVSALMPGFKTPLECTAMIYEYKRVQKTKSCEYAEKLLKMDATNMWAMFVLARNQKDAQDKIKKLAEVISAHPKFARAVNETGIVYGGTLKQYETAIEWYEKATQITPEYSSCYNNIGVNYELLGKEKVALEWYFKAMEKDAEYKAPHDNAIDCFNTLSWDEDDIFDFMKNFEGVKPFYFNYYMGLSYYSKKKYDLSLRWYDKALKLGHQKEHHRVYNSKGITYDDMKTKKTEALECYAQCIKLEPTYHSAYYNSAIVYKGQGNNQKAKEFYKKAIEVNPEYSYAYNNLGNIYKNQQNNQEAIKNYQNAVEHTSTYTLAYANMGVCLLKIDSYREAFEALQRAKECLPHDNNGLSESNKSFLKETLGKFDNEGQNWRKSGFISTEQKAKLESMIKSFEGNFKIVYDEKRSQELRDAKVLRHEVLEVVRLVTEERFELGKIDQVYGHVKRLFFQNEEYFHILPQLFVQYFTKRTFTHKEPIHEVEATLFSTIKRIVEQEAPGYTKDDPAYQQEIRLRKQPTNQKVNLFDHTAFFSDYAELYAEIDKIHHKASASLDEFTEFVDTIREESEGLPYGVSLKMPENPQDQFKVVLRIMEKMFKAEITKDKVRDIISKVDRELRAKAEQGKVSFLAVVQDIVGVWTNEITAILKQRKQDKKETVCTISDLLRGKILFRNVAQLLEAVSVTEELCTKKGYVVVEFDNRLSKPETRDAVFKVQIGGAVCELQLAIKQDARSFHLSHSLYELERSPLGCIFASYIYMSKRFSYPLVNNCRDIEARLKDSTDPKQQEYARAASYIVETLKE